MQEQDLLPDTGEPQARKANGIAHVLVPVAVDIAYSYRIPSSLVVQPGDFVKVPLGAREAQGVVWEIAPDGAAGTLKSIIAKVDLPPLQHGLRDFIDWVAQIGRAHV